MLLLIIFQHLPKFILCFSFKLLSWIWRFKYIWYVLSIAVIVLINTQIVHLWYGILFTPSDLAPFGFCGPGPWGGWNLLSGAPLAVKWFPVSVLIHLTLSRYYSMGNMEQWGEPFFGLASSCTKWLVSDSKLDCYFHFGLLS